jgi:hypothetical protein
MAPAIGPESSAASPVTKGANMSLIIFCLIVVAAFEGVVIWILDRRHEARLKGNAECVLDEEVS